MKSEDMTSEDIVMAVLSIVIAGVVGLLFGAAVVGWLI
jgi:hypothetical protein